MHELICTSATGVAASYFVVGEIYTADEKMAYNHAQSR
ncbi:Uncharacterised protein [Klebsiella pneumoniae]|uniref:Uncharacterized protein n=1 Tax=Klebsiella pneumoniae TaxID=573 RepID=A0A377X9L5_KLEPN|nr:Uncharacterised protein [Klebsiella pneumoniae]